MSETTLTHLSFCIPVHVLDLFVQFLLVVLNVFAIIGCFLVFQPGHEGRSPSAVQVGYSQADDKGAELRLCLVPGP